MKAVEDKYPQVRIPKDLYDDIKRSADRTGKSIGDTIQYAWLSLKGWKKAEMPNEEKRKREFAEKLNEKVNEMKNQVEEQFSLKYQGIIKDLENKLTDAGIDYQALEQERDEWKAKFENEEKTDIKPMLKNRIDELEKELKKFESSDIDSLIKDKELMKSEIEKLKEAIDENKAKIVYAEQLINENKALKEEVSELPQENDNLRKALKNQGMELKWIRDSLTKEIERILRMNSIVDIQRVLERLKDEALRKIDYELQRQEEALI